MKYKYLGQTGVQVSELGFGAMSFGGDADKATSLSLYKAARDAGINYFDTADYYSHGLSEEYLGEFIAHERQNIVLATKFCFPTSEDVNARGTSRKHLFDAIHQSLGRLKTEYVDILFIHRFDVNTPLEETLRALDDLVRDGKILYAGASNFAAWQFMKAEAIAKAEAYARLKCIQLMYNLAKRQAEVELLPMALSERIGVVGYSPLGGGLLSGKYNQSEKPAEGRLTTNPMYSKRYGNPKYLETAAKFTAFARDNGFNPVSLAVRWAATHEAMTCPIIGARNARQLSDSLASVEIEMSSELRATLSSFSETPPPATDRNEEQQ